MLSKRPGEGKSHWKKRHCDDLLYRDGVRCLKGKDITIPIHRGVNVDDIVERLFDELGHDYDGDQTNTIHFDISHRVCCPIP